MAASSNTMTTYSLQPNPAPAAKTDTSSQLGYFALAQGIMTLGNAYASGRVAEAQYNYQAQQIEANVRLGEIQAADAVRRGEKEASEMGKKTRQVVGAQRANFAGQNIAVDQGSALDIQSETRAQGAENILTIKNNAWRESWGYRVQSVSGQGLAAQTRLAADNVMGNTLLTGGLQAANYGAQAYYASNKNSKTTGED